jgi:transglutaminase-like putative cysteine protease
VEAGAGPVHVFVPLARSSEQQRILSETIDASIPGRVETEDGYGNRFWHGSLPVSNGEAITLRVTTRVGRRVHRRAQPASGARRLSDAERGDLARFLSANDHVVVGHEVLDPILSEVRQRSGSDDPAALARASYDWVVDNLEYKKVGTGWGNGDSFWACSTRYGNCTDFHALFISLARTLDIPARFEIGFPVPDSRAEGQVAGYHCWVEFYLPETGWFPIDASEAFKHPENRQLFYGTQPADRIHFTTGRDLSLGDDHRDGTLNYFVYPHVEVAGKRFDGPIAKRFDFRDVADSMGSVQ